MKGKITYVIYTMVIVSVLCISLIATIAYRQSAAPSVSAVKTKGLPATCANNQPSHSGLDSSKHPVLRKLAEYETICKGGVVNQLMIFTAMPTTEKEATVSAKLTSATLKEFARFKIEPLVVFEPNTSKPQVLLDIYGGEYDGSLAAYYQTLKDEGIASRDMGTWVLFPEANTPTWESTDPAIFVKNVNTVGQLQKKYFPTSKISLLLNSRSYQSGDITWSNGSLNTLLPYTNGIAPGLVDTFGYQGFPYVSPANLQNPVSLVTANDFLPDGLALEAAKNLEVNDIWINSGTFARIYTKDPVKTVSSTSWQRQAILREITSVAQKIQNKGYRASINVFAQDKSQTTEQIDWSYWKTDTLNTSPDTEVFDTFLRTLRVNHIGLSLHDQ